MYERVSTRPQSDAGGNFFARAFAAAALVGALFLGALLGQSARRVASAPPPPACAPLDGAETLTAGGARLILLDGEAATVEAAGALLACWAQRAGREGRLGAVFAPGGPAPEAVMTPSAAAALDRIVDNEAARLRAAAPGPARDRALYIALAAQPFAARARLGVSGATWTPLGARDFGAETIALRVEANQGAVSRVRLRVFEDVPRRGAAARYDGLLELAIAPPRANADVLPP